VYLRTSAVTCFTELIQQARVIGRHKLRLDADGNQSETIETQGYGMGYIFEWDSRKAESNLKKHCISFGEATTIFGDPLSLLMDDPKHSADEQRYLVIGYSVQHRLLVVAFAERPPRTRIISARLATRHERNQYEQE
jgi:uncharacterized protein